MTVLVTGAAGFIGSYVSGALLDRGEQVVGLDNLSPYYDVELKKARLARLQNRTGFTFVAADISDPHWLATAVAPFAPLRRVVHLAAQAGVRYSLDHPFEYSSANLTGHLAVLEVCRHTPGFEHLVYASSSSVYGNNEKAPFAETDKTERPASLYAATKSGAEQMSRAYAELYGIRQTGLRFFTVYGPWGRPDMAMYKFTSAVLAGEPIRVFNRGDMERDFTCIDDVVPGVLAALDRSLRSGGEDRHRIYNLGNHRPERLTTLIGLIEKACGRKAVQQLEPMQPGDVPRTFADIAAARRDLGFFPKTSLAEGVPKFVAWYRAYHGE